MSNEGIQAMRNKKQIFKSQKNLYKNKRNIIIGFLQVLVLFSILTFWGMSWYNSDWSTYGVNLLARTREFLNYFVAQSAAQHITPQFFTDYLIIGIIKLGFSYEFATLFWYVISCLIMILGILFLSNVLSKKFSFSCAVVAIIYIVFNSVSASVSGNLLWSNSFLHSSFASTFCIWSLYFMLEQRKRFYLSYLMCVFAALIQIQVGFYFGIIIIAYQVISSIFNKQPCNFYSIFVWLIPTALLLILFAGQSNNLLSNQSFVEIYARLRHPHHMIPSSWSIQGYINLGMFLLSLFLFSYKKLYILEEYRILFYWSITICFLVILALFFNYVFTDIFPWALVVKIQPARMVSMFLLSLTVMVICLIDRCMEEREYIPVVSFVFLFFVNYIHPIDVGIWFFICTLSYLCLQKTIAPIFFTKLGLIAPKILLPVSIIFLIIILWYRQSYGLIFVSFAMCLLSTIFYPTFKGRLHTAIVLLPLMSYGVSMITIPNFFSQNINTSLYNLSLRFQEKTTSDIIYYADPKSSSLEAVSLYSRRTPVVFEKNVPIYDEAIIEWLHRLIAFGVVKTDGKKYQYVQSQLPSNEIITMAKKYGASFIVTDKQDLQSYLDTKRVTIFDSEDNYYILNILR